MRWKRRAFRHHGNPLVGTLTDRLVAEGGSAILTEVPEMFAAETILMNCCAYEAVFQKTVQVMDSPFMRILFPEIRMVALQYMSKTPTL